MQKDCSMWLLMLVLIVLHLVLLAAGPGAKAAAIARGREVAEYLTLLVIMHATLPLSADVLMPERPEHRGGVRLPAARAVRAAPRS